MLKKVIFLGTPTMAVIVLEELLKKARNSLQIILCVTQPPSRSSRHKDLIPSAVHKASLEAGIPVLTPEKCNDPEFLKTLRALEPDLCITASFGQMLPDEFLSIPRYGTVNIHPSLLPLYRGATPVQRAIEDGLKETGVTVLFTVKAMDAGPIIASETYALNDAEDATEVLNTLFLKGSRLLIKSIPIIFNVNFQPRLQDENSKTRALKLTQEESILTKSKLTSLSVEQIHNKVRAFKPWPVVKFVISIEQGQVQDVKIHKTKKSSLEFREKVPTLRFYGKELYFLNETGCLEILELQLPGRQVISGQDFKNFLQQKSVDII